MTCLLSDPVLCAVQRAGKRAIVSRSRPAACEDHVATVARFWQLLFARLQEKGLTPGLTNPLVEGGDALWDEPRVIPPWRKWIASLPGDSTEGPEWSPK